MALPATEVRFHRASRAGGNAPVVLGRADHLYSKLMPQNAGISEERLAPGEGVQIGPANAYTVNANVRLALSGRIRSCELFLEIPGLFEYDLSHRIR
jgi:hypothetical protein